MGWGWKEWVVNVVTGGQLILLEKELSLGGEVVKVVIDVNNEIVHIGQKVFKAIPAAVLFPGLGPLSGLLKNQISDELLFMSPLGLVPSISVFIDGALWVGKLVGVVKYRTMRKDELEIARYVFRDSIQQIDQIKLTNLAGFEGRPFTIPSYTGAAIINLGKKYVHDGHISDEPTLIHELTHVWQIQRSFFPELFLCSAGLVQLQNSLDDKLYGKTDSQYAYSPGAQWNSYNLEQQAHIVEDWAREHMRLDPRLFRYVNGNIRPKNYNSSTAAGGSVRAWLAAANVHTGSLRTINPPRPQTWW